MMFRGLIVNLVCLIVCSVTIEQNEILLRVDLCRPCPRRSGNFVLDNTADNIVKILHEIRSETIRETCRYYSAIFNGDTSPVYNFNYNDIPASHTAPVESGFHITKAIDILTDISLYRQLGQLQNYTFEGIFNVRFPVDKMRRLVCSLTRVADISEIDIPEAVCKKHLIVFTPPTNGATYAKWMFSILRHNNEQLCHVNNALSHDIQKLIHSEYCHYNVLSDCKPVDKTFC